jgi:hypothetical protein
MTLLPKKWHKYSGMEAATALKSKQRIKTSKNSITIKVMEKSILLKLP